MIRVYFKRRRSLVRQYEEKDCGPAALLSVLRFYGGNSTLSDIRNRCYTSARGTTMYDIVEAAKEIGFDARGVVGTAQILNHIKLPCIAHWILESGLQHYVIIFGIKSQKILVGDPGKGLTRFSLNKFEKLWRTRALIILNPEKKLIKKHVQKWYEWLFPFIRKERAWLYQIIFLGMIHGLAGLIMAAFIKTLIDHLIPMADQRIVLWSAVFIGVLLILRSLIGWVRACFMVTVNRRIGLSLQTTFISHLFELSMRFFDMRRRGEITARLHDCVYIHNAIVKICGTFVIDLVLIVSSLVYMYILVSSVAWLTLSVIPVFTGTVLWKVTEIRKRQHQVMSSFTEMESTCIDSLNVIEDIISFNTTRQFARRNIKKCIAFQDHTARLGDTQAGLNFWADLTTAGISLVVLTYGALSVIWDQIQLGQMIAAYSLLAQMIPSLIRIVDTTVIWQGAIVSAKRLLDILQQDREDKRTGKQFRMNLSLLLNQVEYGWTRTNNLFFDISMPLWKGRITALYGKSGSGKTTLANLMQRKFDPRKGNLCVDSNDARSIKLGEYRKKVSVVPQEVNVFTGTLLDNILIGRDMISGEAFSEFIHKYHMSHFISRFQQGLFTMLGEEARRLSGGEKQMLGLARALLSEPDVLLIDEGFNAMDQDLYVYFFTVVKHYAKNAAIMINTHNLDTLLNADVIYLLKNGRVQRISKRDVQNLSNTNPLLKVADTDLNKKYL